MVQALKKSPILFSARLTPYRSLSQRGFYILMLIIALISLFSSLAFVLKGAWPVLVFFVIDFFLIYLAFKLNYRSARKFEQITLRRDGLNVLKSEASGRSTNHAFNPFWTRFVVARHDDFGVTAMKLVQRGDELTIGAFLNPEDKNSFARAFSGALAKAKS